MYIVDIDRKSVEPVKIPQLTESTLEDIIHNRTSNSDFVVYNPRVDFNEGWEDSIKMIPDDVDIAFLSDVPMTAAHSSKLAKNLYRTDVIGCMYAVYFNSSYARRLKSSNEIVARITYDIYNGNIIASKYRRPIAVCSSKLLHGVPVARNNLVRYSIYMSYFNLALAVALIIAFGFFAKKIVN